MKILYRIIYVLCIPLIMISVILTIVLSPLAVLIWIITGESVIFYLVMGVEEIMRKAEKKTD